MKTTTVPLLLMTFVMLFATTGSARAMEQLAEKSEEQFLSPAQELRIFTDKLKKAVIAKDFDTYFALLNEGSVENQKSLCNSLVLEEKSGKKALHFAAQQGNTQAVIKLLDLGADKECTDAYGKTALLYAARSHFNTMALLLQKGAN